MHIPVLVSEVVAGLRPVENGIYVDGTVGYGGHAEALLKTSSLQLIGLDRDIKAIEHVQQKFTNEPRARFVHASYEQIPEALSQLGVQLVDGVLLDLGASSPQFDQAERGFSFKDEGPLDMRFDQTSGGQTAQFVLSTYEQSDLARIIREYGEERFANKIATAIVRAREEKPLASTKQLAELIERTIPRRSWPTNIHPATRTFQALRIEVNKELQTLEAALPKLVNSLKPGGRVAIISFHSLEDRIVKNFFRHAAKTCVCPPELPLCRCEKKQTLKVLTKKPIIAQEEETNQNPRARSAKLRIAERV
jgi:16S rRNA (cytosine1402-N4)-methyltransferase